MRLLSSAIQEGESIPQRFTGARTRLLPPENATGNLVKVVQRLPVRIRLNDGEDRELCCALECRLNRRSG